MTKRPDDTAASEAAPLEPSAETLAEIDRLDQLCRDAPGEVAPQIDLWTAVTSLDNWVIINRGTPEEPRPYALAADAGPMVCIYTSATRAKEAAHSAGLVPAGGAVSLMLIPLPAALDWALSLGGRGVVGVTVDHPILGAWCPLPNLAGLRDRRAAAQG